jgi:hypothetical protein
MGLTIIVRAGFGGFLALISDRSRLQHMAEYFTCGVQDATGFFFDQADALKRMLNFLPNSTMQKENYPSH